MGDWLKNEFKEISDLWKYNKSFLVWICIFFGGAILLVAVVLGLIEIMEFIEWFISCEDALSAGYCRNLPPKP